MEEKKSSSLKKGKEAESPKKSKTAKAKGAVSSDEDKVRQKLKFDVVADGPTVAARVLEELRERRRPAMADLLALCSTAATLLGSEPNLLRLSSPINIIGDLHGSWGDLEYILAHTGTPPASRLLFLGDYVDRGADGLEVLAQILALKVLNPIQVYMLRGNHESQDINQVYGFLDELQTKFGGGSAALFDAVLEVWKALPLAATVDEKIFCAHAGLPGKRTLFLNKIDLIQRKMSSILAHGDLACLVWSDPLQDEDDLGWETSARNAGLMWGVDVLRRWHRGNQLELTVRAHQLVQGGYYWHQQDRLLTLFSASFYDGQDNRAAYLHVPSADCHTRATLESHVHTYRVKPSDARDGDYLDAVVVPSKLFRAPTASAAVAEYFGEQ